MEIDSPTNKTKTPNEKLKKHIWRHKLKYWQIANVMNVEPEALYYMLEAPLTPEQEKEVRKAVSFLLKWERV